jgi:hypothetical protein
VPFLLALDVLDGVDKIFVRGQNFAELEEGANNKDVHLPRPLTP